ncbi:cation:proton antiporter [Candidatus Woesearchaeota archaeon]|nr:cation:proton antiporter [Candidatus Woesearchaeota archaeon]
MGNGILILGIVILIGFIGKFFFNKTRIPESVFLMLIGILLGPVFNVVSGKFFIDNASFLISLALVVVLLDSGLTLNISKALKNAPTALIFTILVMLSTVAIVSAVTVLFFGWPLINGIFLGIIGSGTTTITITHLVEKLSVGKNTKTLLVLESIVNDITLITAVSILISFVLSDSGKVSIFKVIFNELVISVILGVAFALIWAYVFLRYIHGNKLAYVFTLGIAFIIFDGVEFFGFNGAIAVLIFSLALGNYSALVSKLKAYSKILIPIKADISIVRGINTEITFIMRTLFFVFLGVIFNTSVIKWNILLFVFIIVVAEVTSRYAAAKTLALLKPSFANSVPVITTLVASGFTSTLVAFLSIEAGINIPNLAEIVLLLVMFTTLWAIIGSAVLERKIAKYQIETY